jgi:hypothetical protein
VEIESDGHPSRKENQTILSRQKFQSGCNIEDELQKMAIEYPVVSEAAAVPVELKFRLVV